MTWPWPLRRSLLALDDAGGAHARSDAHGDHAELPPGALQLRQQCGDLPRAGAAEGVAQGDGTALRVHLLHRDLEVLDGHGRLRGEGLVDLEDVHVLGGEVCLLERRGDGKGRASPLRTWTSS